MKATESHHYKLLDEILETRQTLTKEPDVPTKKIDRLIEHNTIEGSPDDLLNLDWSDLWNPDPSTPL